MLPVAQVGLGTKLRLLLARLDGELAELYKSEGYHFRPRFYPVFHLLMRSEQASVSKIASHLQVSQPAATQTLTEMKRLNLVTYKAGRDRRERVVNLTPHAIETAEKLQPLWEAVERAATQLNEELSYPLSAILDEANFALAKRSFPDRIAKHRSHLGE